jgi:hypothetical protein
MEDILKYSKTLPWNDFKKFVALHLKITPKGTRTEIFNLFRDYLISQDIEILRGIIAKIEKA